MALDFMTGDAVRSCVSIHACIDLMASTMVSVSRWDSGSAATQHRRAWGFRKCVRRHARSDQQPGRVWHQARQFLSAQPPLPAIQGLIVVFEGRTGRPIAVVDAVAVTALRTAAASGVATRLLAREDAKTLALIGYGVQAESHLQAMQAVRPLERVVVWGRSQEKAREFAQRHRVCCGNRDLGRARCAVSRGAGGYYLHGHK